MNGNAGHQGRLKTLRAKVVAGKRQTRLRISVVSVLVGALFVTAVFLNFLLVKLSASPATAPGFGQFPLFHVLKTGVAIAIAAFAVQTWAVYSLSRDGGSAGSVELFFAGVVPMAAALYFVYQFAAGALFATTSVSLDAALADDQPDSAVLTMKLERGDNWIVEIVSAAVTMEHPHYEAKTWQESNLPRRQDGTLRLAPKETTATKFRVALPQALAASANNPAKSNDPAASNDVARNDIVVTARVVSYALWWPVPSESFASTLIVPRAASAASSGAPATK